MPDRTQQEHTESDAEQKGVKGAALLMKACDILDLVGTKPGQLTARDLVEATGLAKSTVYRIVAALSERGFVRAGQNDQKLLLGFHFLDLAQSIGTEMDLATIAADELRRLREMTGETAYLAALMGNEMVSLAKSVGAHENSSTAALGGTKPVYATSQGKAILAFLPERRVDHILNSLTFRPVTDYTITDRNTLQLSLNIIRQRGFAIDDQENIVGTRCIGVPILDAGGQPVAAISVAGPAYRMTLERIEQLAPELIDAGRRLGHLVKEYKAKSDNRSEWRITPLGEAAFQGAKPFWDEHNDCVYWIDRLAPAIYAMLDDDLPKLLAQMPGPISEALPARGGGIYVVCEGEWHHASLQEGCRRIDRPRIRDFRALCTRPGGSTWATLVEDGGSKIGSLSARGEFQPEWTVAREIDESVWSRDGERLYALSRNDGLIYEMRRGRDAALVLSRIPRGSGEPCALTVDDADRLWVALKDGWGVARLNENGEIEQVLALPVPYPSGLVFGGKNRATLYVTSARLGVGREMLEHAPLSGRLLKIEIGISEALSSVNRAV
ncbi:IclR family transcriptional regulator domain-containing protein [Martelella radicis]|uniref:DNA-binding IclR family transcriptional regulator/sugar lactone lactonase YvrE n=1 Tax=Martelella radicis TaxID=1397476 RepID=A0A7W6KNM7_9HYPH|nr:IclR family transcriptional regulator C-terminal domain-containing protein [Martelella radicis]MBB4124591.1 DNA-binding IclR family transcriptional regulator/sugar lactone lactonase YvrE [Martelella radicis]